MTALSLNSFIKTIKSPSQNYLWRRKTFRKCIFLFLL